MTDYALPVTGTGTSQAASVEDHDAEVVRYVEEAVAAEATARAAAITTEATARAAADTALDLRLDALEAAGNVETADLADGAVTNAKLADMAQATFKGRASGAGTGDPQDLTASQARTALGLGTAATTDATDYATAAQGELADSAVQPGDDVSVLAETSTAKIMTASERTKLAGIEAGAQVNAVTSVAGRTGAVTLAKADVGLGNVDNTSDVNKPVSTAQAAGDREVGLSSGDMLAQSSVAYEMLNGAVEISVSGRRVGMTIGGSVTAAGSYVVPRLTIHPDDAARLAGKTVRIRTVMTATEDFVSEKGFGGNAVRVEMQDGTTLTNAGTAITPTQTGTTITRDMTYVMVGTERTIGATMQIGGAATAVGTDHSFQITSVSWEVLASGEDAATAGDTMLEARQALAVTPLAGAFDLLTGIPQTFNGATKRYDARGREMGVTIPTGQTGQTTILQHALQIGPHERDNLAGATIRVTLGYDTSAAFARTFTVNMQARGLDGSYDALTASNVQNVQISSTRRQVEFTFVMPSDAADLRPWLQFTSSSAAVADEHITLTDCAYSVDRQSGDLIRRGAETAAWGDAIARRVAAADGIGGAVGYGRGVGIVLDSADYASVQEALDAASAMGAPGQVVAVNLEATTYAERSLDGLNGADHVALIGAGIGKTIIDGTLPEDTTIATIQATSTVDFDGAQEMRGITFIAQNQRYAWHLDAVKTKPDTLIRAFGCEFIHRGNDDAESYNGGVTGETTTGRVTWGSMHAVGCGLSSGQRAELIDCIARGPRAGVQVHNQLWFTKSCEFVLDGCDLSAEWVAYWPLLIQSNGSGTPDRVTLRNTALSGRIRMDAVPWFPADLSYQPANHMEFTLTGSGNSPCAVDVVDFGRALRIDSATTGLSSSVEIGGSAAALLFGDVTTIAGDVGRAGAAYGYLDIQDATGVGPSSSLFITGLGKRLGNRASLGSVTLTVTVDGGSPINVVLSGDYSASSNSTILGIINTALGSAATASEFNVGGTYRPMFTDQERRLKNTDTTTILQGHALARGASDRQVRLMTSADAMDLFAGIALEDIRPGEYGRVQHRGWIALGWVLRKSGEGSTINLGDSFNIDAAAPGRITRISGDAGILKCVTPSLGASLTTLEIAK